MNFDDFETMEFPPADYDTPRGFVYVFCWVKNGTEIPFYVGQTRRFMGRISDYCSANFKACTDFAVGVAAQYFKTVKNYRVIVRYKATATPEKDEREIIRALRQAGVSLLNDFPRYDYRTADEAEERRAVQRNCDSIIFHQSLDI